VTSTGRILVVLRDIHVTSLSPMSGSTCGVLRLPTVHSTGGTCEAALSSHCAQSSSCVCLFRDLLIGCAGACPKSIPISFHPAALTCAHGDLSAPYRFCIYFCRPAPRWSSPCLWTRPIWSTRRPPTVTRRQRGSGGKSMRRQGAALVQGWGRICFWPDSPRRRQGLQPSWLGRLECVFGIGCVDLLD